MHGCRDFEGDYLLTVYRGNGNKPLRYDEYDLTIGGAGAEGLSAYEVWLAEGNTGDEAAFLASLVGPAGIDGVDGLDGTVWLTGTVDPTGEGDDGDLYLNTASSEYFLKSGGTWLSQGNLTGPQGIAGTDGADGAPGKVTITFYDSEP